MRADPKDIILAILGASTALAGLILVFSGFLASKYMALDPEFTNEQDLRKLKRLSKVGLVPFLLSIASGGFAFEWLVSPSENFYGLSVNAFWTLGFSTAVYGILALFRLF